uniref:Calponin-homology (CH) domain-containing protein n=1 Tax=Nelumbo nucifera TaxID=4432 RepID=A0A822XY42_NELNU|nr:TPA_asm: hypothetical protein HUJ06_025492 [Nelumbo nucifera]
MTLLHTISGSEKTSYVALINNYLAEDQFLKRYLPIDPSTNDLFEIVKDGVLLCKLINVAVPGTTDERAINTKRVLNPWERNENLTLSLISAKAIGCTVVNIGVYMLFQLLVLFSFQEYFGPVTSFLIVFSVFCSMPKYKEVKPINLIFY